MEINLISEGFSFMVLGMSSVFIFLIIMIYVLKFQSFLIQKFTPDTKKQEDNHINLTKQNKQIDQEVVAAISIAVSKFRKDQLS